MSADAATAVAAATAAAAAASEPAVEVPDRPMLLRELGLLMHKMAGVNPQVRRCAPRRGLVIRRRPTNTLRTPLPRQDEVAVLAAAVSLLRTISATGGRPSGPVEADESCDRPHKRQELGQSRFGQGVDPQRKPAAAASSRRRATGPRRTTGSSTKEPLPPEKVSVLLQHFHNHQYVSPEVRETHAMCRCAVPCLKNTVSTHAFHLSAVRAAADVAVDAARARPEEGPPYPFFANPSPNCLSLFAHTSTVLALRGPVAATSLLLTA